MKQISQKKVKTAFYLLVFIGLMLFFTYAHPMYIYNGDDWTYASSPRPAVPMPFGWNPTRILPEILMPFFAQIGVSCIEPFLHDYVLSLAMAFALALSGTILLYLAGLDHLLQKVYQLKEERYLLLLMLLLWHFLPFCTEKAQYQHMFCAANVTGVFYYTIPALFNMGAAFLVMSGYKLSRKDKALFNGFVLLGIYLCINSNMYHSIILAAAVSGELFCSWLQVLKTKKKFWSSVWTVICENRVKTGIVCMWFASVLLEWTGGRAHWTDDAQGFQLGGALSYFAQSVKAMNLIWLIGTAVVVAAALIVCALAVKKDSTGSAENQLDRAYLHQMAVCGFSLVICIVYLVLLSAKVNPQYLMPSNVKISWVIWCFAALAFSMAYLLKRCPRTAALLPLLLCIVVSVVVMDGDVYADYNEYSYSAQLLKEVDESIIRQAQEADRKGLKAVEIYIPDLGSEDWPLPLSYGGERIARTLYRHGLTSTKLEIQLVIDETAWRQ